MGDYWDHRPYPETAVLVGVINQGQTEELAGEYLDELASLESIGWLDLEFSSVKSLTGLTSLNSLESLTIRGWRSLLVDLSGLENTSITHGLRIEGASSLVNLSGIENTVTIELIGPGKETAPGAPLATREPLLRVGLIAWQ